jgi:cyclic pyranopterin monophosphate synthase
LADRPSEMSHVGLDGRAQMVDVSGKAVTFREATVEGRLYLLPCHIAALGALPKGDALTIAQVAGIQGGKRCSELIPLCHPVGLSKLDVVLALQDDSISIRATAKTEAQTGVEMEAYTAVAIAGVTLIDMLKGVDPDLTLGEIRLILKTGGKAPWVRKSES